MRNRSSRQMRTALPAAPPRTPPACKLPRACQAVRSWTLLLFAFSIKQTSSICLSALHVAPIAMAATAHSHSHDGITPHSHDHNGFNAAEHGHSHEILDGPGSYMGREMPIIEGRDWSDRAFTVGIGGYARSLLNGTLRTYWASSSSTTGNLSWTLYFKDQC